MTNIKFPKALVVQQVEEARTRYEKYKGKTRNVGDIETGRYLGYKRPDGSLRTAYNVYDPEYPEDSEAGWVTSTAIYKFYPNATYGWEFSANDFEPLGEQDV